METDAEAQALLPSTSTDAASVDYAALYDSDGSSDDAKETASIEEKLSVSTIICILSTAFSYGCIMTTLFLITLPIECNRLNVDHPDIPKSVALGIFVAIAGVTQLVSPLVGRLSDTYVPPVPHDLGQRMPYLVLGSILTCTGLIGQTLASFYGFWMRYSFAFFTHMIGLNIMYAMMIALIPDQVPRTQTGIANGILAFLLVTGSIFGFGLYYYVLREDIQSMYMLYTCIVIFTTIATGTHAHDRDAEIAYNWIRRRRRSEQIEEFASPEALSQKPRWQRAAQKFAKQAAKKAKDIVLTPTLILKTMLVDPLTKLSGRELCQSYTIDTVRYHDFFVVTISRLFYYCGMSVQTFFLYYVHDILGVRDNPETVVATLAILGQFSGAITCYPVGFLSDRVLGGRRKPFVYLSCAILATSTVALIFIRELQQMWIVSLVLGGANGMYLTMDTSLAVDTLPKDDGGSAQLLGIWGVAAFLGSALGPMIGGPLLYVFGRDESAPSEEYTIEGYGVVLALSTLYFFASATALFFLRDHQE